MASSHTYPARVRMPVLSSSAPLAAAGILAAVFVGVMLARDAPTGIGALLGLLYVPVIMLNLPLGVALYVPLEFVSRLPAASIGPTAALLLVFLAWLGTLRARREVVAATLRRTPGLFLVLLLLVVWVTMSIAWAADVSQAGTEFWDWWISAAIFLIVATSFTQRRYAAAVCAAFVAGALISVVAGLVPLGSGGGFGEAGRFNGSYGDPNILATGLVPAIVLTVGLASVYKSTGQRALLAFSGMALAVGLAASGSRGGIVAALVSVAAALVMARGRRLSVIALVVAVVSVGGLWMATASPSTWDRIREVDTGTGRTDLWQVALRMSEAYPVQGVGLGGYAHESPRFIRQPGGALPTGPEFTRIVLNEKLVTHNTYLQMLAETGIVGLALLLVLIVASWRTSWKASRIFERARDTEMAALARAVLIAQIGVASAMVFVSNYYDKRLWILLALGPALLAIAARSQRSEAT